MDSRSNQHKSSFLVVLTVLVLLLGFRIETHAQGLDEKRVCHSTEYENKLRSKFPGLGTRADFELSMKKAMDLATAARSTNQAYDTIPVIVHVVHNGDDIGVNENISQAQVNSQLVALNNDYGKIPGTLGDNSLSFSSDSKIRFALALYDPNGNLLAEPGIHRVLYPNQVSWTDSLIDATLKPNTQWDPKRYLNIWTVSFGGASKSLLGYAQFPESANSGLTDLQSSEVANTDGVVISYRAFGTTGNLSTTYNKGRTTSHEVGHFLGLYHTWGDQTDCSGTDYCADTPPCSDEYYDCPSTAPVQCSGVSRLISNYMDYTPDACMNNFTNNQVSRMHAVLHSSPRRLDLLSSTVHILDNSPFPRFTQNTSLICEGEEVILTDNSTNTPTGHIFSILPTGSSIPTVTFSGSPFTSTITQSGVYDIALTSSNAFGQNTVLKSQYLGVISQKQLSIPFVENFQSSTFLTDWISYNLDTLSNWKRTTPTITVDGVSKTVIGSSGSATYAYYENNYEDDFSNTRDAIISPAINMSNYSSLNLSFDVAYATILTGGTLYTDTLQVWVTTNCGASFEKIWQKGGTQLTTTTFKSAGFVPTSKNVWRKETIVLSNYIQTCNFNLALVNLSGFANNLFLDNISISGTVMQAVPASSFSASPTIVCQGQSVQFSDLSTNKPTAWNWQFSGATATSSFVQNPVVSCPNVGVYDVQLTASNIAGTGTTHVKSGYIQVVTMPTISLAGTTLYSSLGTGNQWYYNNLPIAGATDTYYPIPSTNSGTYYVINTLAGASCQSNTQLVVPTDLSATERGEVIALEIFPIPSSHKLTINLTGDALDVSDITISNVLGQSIPLVVSEIKDDHSVVLDISAYAPGTYITASIIHGQTLYRKWVKW